MAQPSADFFIMKLVLWASALYALKTLQWAPQVRQVFSTAEDAIQSVFFVEYMLRWYSRNCRPSYLVKWEMIVDLLAWLPLLLEAAGIRCTGVSLQFLRLLRIGRVGRFMRDRQSFAQLIGAESADSIKPFRFELVRTVSIVVSLLWVCSGVVYVAECSSNPAFPNFFVAMYFGLVTLTTVGFGDITPITPLGRFSICVSILLGVAILPLQLSRLTKVYFNQRRERERSKSGASDEEPAEEPVEEPVDEEDFQSMVLVRLDAQQQQLHQLARALGGGAPLQPCSRCGVQGHRREALFCFNCGAPMPQAPKRVPEAQDADESRQGAGE